MPEIFLTADLHFGHANIIRYCKRPWLKKEDIDSNGQWVSNAIAKERTLEMDEELIANWNKMVSPKDFVYVLGDFCFKDPIAYADRLNGRKFFIPGNHDKVVIKKHADKLHVLDSIYSLRLGEIKIVLCHYPMVVWDRSHLGYLHAHGHCHGTLPRQINNSFDVGVDPNFYTPVLIDTFIALMDIYGKDPISTNWIKLLPGFNESEYEEALKNATTKSSEK